MPRTRQRRTIDQLVAECGARAGRGVGGTRARACDRPDSSRNWSEPTDAGSSAPTRSSGVRYRSLAASGTPARPSTSSRPTNCPNALFIALDLSRGAPPSPCKELSRTRAALVLAPKLFAVGAFSTASNSHAMMRPGGMRPPGPSINERSIRNPRGWRVAARTHRSYTSRNSGAFFRSAVRTDLPYRT